MHPLRQNPGYANKLLVYKYYKNMITYGRRHSPKTECFGLIAGESITI